MLRLHAAVGVTIHCNNGLVWITQEGRAMDDFLSAGKSLCIASDGVTLVEAVGDKAVRLTLRALRAYGRVISAFPAAVTF
jgi:hypothetical protein